jgi:glycogen operon protein
MNRWHAVEGAPSPFGATWIESEQSYNFAIYSKHAGAVTLLLYSEDDVVNPVYSHRMVGHDIQNSARRGARLASGCGYRSRKPRRYR